MGQHTPLDDTHLHPEDTSLDDTSSDDTPSDHTHLHPEDLWRLALAGAHVREDLPRPPVPQRQLVVVVAADRCEVLSARPGSRVMMNA